MIKRVLTIDTDIIIGKDMPIYNNLVHSNDRDKVWQEIYKVHPDIKGNVQYDKAVVTRLFTFLEQTLALNPNMKINVTRNHDGVLTLLAPDMKEGTKFSVVNIDNHHDIWFNDGQFIDAMHGRGSLANWVGYLYCQGVLEDYIWLKAIHSPVSIPDNFICTNIVQLVHKILRTPLENLDYLNLCWSPEWVPKELDWVFFKMKDLIDTHLGYKTEIDEAFYTPQDTVKPLDIKDKPY